MTKEEKFLEFIKEFNIESDTYRERKFLAEEAVKKGAVVSHSVRMVSDFYFDKNGMFVGSTTQSAGSWRPFLKVVK